MKLDKFLSALAVCCALAICSAGVSAAVIGATVADASSGNYTLTSVSVTRGSAGTFTYVPSQLTGVDLTHVDAFSVPLLVQRGASLPAAGTRAALLEDGRLDTGVTNITTINGEPSRSAQVTFASPIVNSAGEDILLFDVDGLDGVRFWINDDRAGQGADAPSTAFSGNLLSGMPVTWYKYDTNGDAPGGDVDVNSLAELESPTGYSFHEDTSTVVRAVGLDLSSVGVPLGGTISSIRFQSLTGSGLGRVDPVLIVGLPAVPEPTSVSLAAVAGAAMLRRRRRSL